jgi:hypothetical protein
MSKLLMVNPHLRVLESHERIDSSFRLLKENAGKWVCRISHIILGCPEFEKADIGVICEIFAKEEIQALTICNGLTTFLAETLLCGLRSAKSLKMLVLSGIRHLEIQKHFKALETLDHLSLKSCDLEISDFLSCAFESPSFCVQILDLSGNRCTGALQGGFKIPHTLTHLSLREVKWSLECFTTILERSLLLEIPIMLNFGKAGIDSDHMKGIFTRIADTLTPPFGEHFRVIGMVWDENPLCSDFFDLLDRCRPMTRLSLNGCFSYKDEYSPMFAEFLRFNETLEELKIAGSAERILSVAHLMSILSELKENKTILRIDFSNNFRSDALVEEVSNIFMLNKTIKYAVFGSTANLTVSVLQRCVASLRGRGVPLKLVMEGVTDPELLRGIRRLAETSLCGTSAAEEETGQRRGRPRAPSYRRERIGSMDESPSEGGKEDSWAVEVDDIPEVDNSKIVKRLEDEFTVRTLLNERGQSHPSGETDN